MSDRPRMPAGYGIATDDTGRLPWAVVAEQLRAARNYWVVTCRPDGRPHAMPVWGLWLHGAVLFSTDPESRKGRNLAANPAAVIHLESGDDVVVCEGTVGSGAAGGFDDDLTAEFVARYADKYGVRMDPGNEAFGLYRMRPQVVLAWRESDFPTSATRWAGAAIPPGEDRP